MRYVSLCIGKTCDEDPVNDDDDRLSRQRGKRHAMDKKRNLNRDH